jgi:hypothetical protein
MKTVETPLYLHMLEMCRMYEAENDVPVFIDNISEKKIQIEAGRGIEIEYSQRERPEGDYEEEVSVRKDIYQRKHSCRFQKVEDQIFFRGSEGTAHYMKHYRNPGASIQTMMEEVREEFNRIEGPKRFASDIALEFVPLRDAGCELFYILNGKNLVYVGDKRFLETVNSAPSVSEGLRDAYIKHRQEMFWYTGVETLDGIIAAMPAEGGHVGLFTKQLALNLLGRAEFDVEDYLNNRFVIKNLEFSLPNHMFHVERFFSYLMMPDVFDILAERYHTDAGSILHSVKEVERSQLVRNAEQITGIEKILASSPESSPEEALGLDTSQYHKEITSEFHLIKIHWEVYKDYCWWKRLKDKIGVHFSDTLDRRVPSIEERVWKQDWTRRMQTAYARLPEYIDALRNIDYSMLLHISPERYPDVDQRARRYQRKGIGNMLIDLGGKERHEQIEAASSDVNSGMGRYYDANKQRITGHLFRGRMLQLVLEKMFREQLPNGGTIALTTTSERARELLRFCDIKEDKGGMFDRQTLVYKGVNMVLLDADSRSIIQEAGQQRAK